MISTKFDELLHGEYTCVISTQIKKQNLTPLRKPVCASQLYPLSREATTTSNTD